MQRKAAKTPAKGAGKPVTGKKRSAPITKRCGGQAVKKGRESLVKKPTAKGIFTGATEISLTQNKIAVTRSSSKSVKGMYAENTTRVYHDPTPANVRALKDVVNESNVKKITVALK